MHVPRCFGCYKLQSESTEGNKMWKVDLRGHTLAGSKTFTQGHHRDCMRFEGIDLQVERIRRDVYEKIEKGHILKSYYYCIIW